jgi:hypothetical protein
MGTANKTYLDLLIHLGQMETQQEIRNAFISGDYTPSENMLLLKRLIALREKLGESAGMYKDRKSIGELFLREDYKSLEKIAGQGFIETIVIKVNDGLSKIS